MSGEGSENSESILNAIQNLRFGNAIEARDETLNDAIEQQKEKVYEPEAYKKITSNA